MVWDEKGGLSEGRTVLTLPWNEVADPSDMDLVRSRSQMVRSHLVMTLALEHARRSFVRRLSYSSGQTVCLEFYRRESPNRHVQLQVSNSNGSVWDRCCPAAQGLA